MPMPVQVNLADYQPKQDLAHRTLEVVDELYYGGAAFGGKSEFGVRYWSQYALTYAGARVGVFRVNKDDLRDSLIPRFRELLDPLGVGHYVGSAEMEYRLDNGTVIAFRHCEFDHEVAQYDTTQFHGMWIEEGSQFSTYRSRRLRVRCRSSNPAIPARFLVTSNPDGIGNEWLVEDFVDHDPAGTGKVHEATYQIPLPGGGSIITETKRRAFIQSFASDNPRGMETNPGYMVSLWELPEDDRNAKLYGDHTKPAGQFFKEWSRGLHIIEYFDPPAHWPAWRGIDFGYNSFCCLWGAQDPLTGRITIYDELYWSEQTPWIKPMTDPDAKRTICQKTGARRIITTVADPAGRQRRSSSPGSAPVSTWDIYGRHPHAIPLSPGQRQPAQRLQAIRAGLRDLPDGKPGLHVTDNCIHLSRTLPKLVYHKVKPGHIADGQEDHPCDTLGYMLLSPAIVTPALADAIQNTQAGLPFGAHRDRDRDRDYIRPRVASMLAGRGR